MSPTHIDPARRSHCRTSEIQTGTKAPVHQKISILNDDAACPCGLRACRHCAGRLAPGPLPATTCLHWRRPPGYELPCTRDELSRPITGLDLPGMPVTLPSANFTLCQQMCQANNACLACLLRRFPPFVAYTLADNRGLRCSRLLLLVFFAAVLASHTALRMWWSWERSPVLAQVWPPWDHGQQLPHLVLRQRRHVHCADGSISLILLQDAVRSRSGVRRWTSRTCCPSTRDLSLSASTGPTLMVRLACHFDRIIEATQECGSFSQGRQVKSRQSASHSTDRSSCRSLSSRACRASA
jgi:hypothetical protein